MKTYAAYFYTDAGFATRGIKATTPEQALKKARRLCDNDPLDLMLVSYDGGMPVHKITICDGEECEGELAVWREADLRLRLAPRDLLEAAELVVARWERGDLAEAVRGLDSAVVKAKGGAA